MLYMIVYVENPHPHYDLIWCQKNHAHEFAS